MRYDIGRLKALAEYDAEVALKNYTSENEYFDALSKFANSARSYLRMYNPTLVIYSNDIRADFLAELEDIKGIFNRIGVRLDGREIENIEGAVETGNEKVLSDGLVKFFAKMEILTGCIEEARLDGNQTADANNGLPMILAVDDMPQILAAITDMLDEHYNLIAVASGKAALKVLETRKPSLFLLDIEMPDMNGFELAGAIRKIKGFENTPILFLTGNRSLDYVLAAKALGIHDYILKPVDKEVLINKIGRVLEP